MPGRSDLERRQRRWADTAGLDYDAAGYVRELAANLRASPCAQTQAELARGSELTPGRLRPARLRSLTSSAALVLNVFDHWRDRDTAPLVAALGLRQGSPRLCFEEPLVTGLEGDPPLADVVLRWPDGRIVSIESKFGEWLVRRPRNKSGFKRKYFPPGQGVWAAVGRPLCQALAADIDSGRERFRYLHAAQLLKHALGLAKSGAAESTLLYLYYDNPGRERDVHEAELERFTQRVLPELDFRALTYQTMFAALHRDAAESPGYYAYLRARYFA
jgi:Restriction Endonuclease associating with ARP